MTNDTFYLAVASIYGAVHSCEPDTEATRERDMNAAIRDATELWRRSHAAMLALSKGAG